MDFDIRDLNFKTNLPIFNDKCNTIFKSLKKFNLIIFATNYNDKKIEIDSKINNLCNNIDKMPNLKEFTFRGFNYMFDEISYKNLIKKILSLKLITNIKLEPTSYSENYSRKELAELFPDICINKINEICITKSYKIENENEIIGIERRRRTAKQILFNT